MIGYEGTTGFSTGCHVHFAINDHGIWENPRFLPALRLAVGSGNGRRGRSDRRAVQRSTYSMSIRAVLNCQIDAAMRARMVVQPSGRQALVVALEEAGHDLLLQQAVERLGIGLVLGALVAISCSRSPMAQPFSPL